MRCWPSLATALAALAAMLAIFAARAAGPADTRVTGSLAGFNPSGGYSRITFACTGMPVCTGIHNDIERDPGCSNTFSYSDTVVVTGVDLSHSGAFQGYVMGSVVHHDTVSNADGTCTYLPMPGGQNQLPYAATWDGTNGTITVTANYNGVTFPISGTFTASLPAASPVFPMTVNASITPTVVTASALIQPRPQDVGTTASIFVFAHAPANMLKDAIDKRDAPAMPAAAKDDAVVCVLAQIDGHGQLVAVSASSMQAYLTGILSSQTQAVGILTNVPTPIVAGTTFFIGYGTSAGTMIATGVYQTAVTIPGAVQCSASLASAPAPSTPGALTGLWWNAAESGWGIHFTQRGPNIFGAWYTYDSAGNPKWYVLATCTGISGNSGICNGPLFQVTGPSFFGGAFNPSLVNATNAGTAQVNFRDVNSVSMTYTVAGQTRTIALVRQPLAAGTTPPAVDYTDLWWNPSESGWGMAMAQQYGITFLAWYVYDSSGRPTWRVATCTMSGSSCSGTLYRTTGPAFGPAFDPSLVHAAAAGTILVIFTDANNAILTFTVDGVTATKSVTRQLF